MNRQPDIRKALNEFVARHVSGKWKAEDGQLNLEFVCSICGEPMDSPLAHLSCPGKPPDPQHEAVLGGTNSS